MHRIFLAALTVPALICFSNGAAMAQQKKTPPATVNAYKQCCDKSNARFYVHNGMATCFAMSESQQELLNACIHQHGIRVIQQGQKSL